MTQTLSLFSMLRYFQETCQNLQAWCFDTVFLHVPNKHLLLPQLSLFPVNTNKEIYNKITLYIKYNSIVHARHIRSIVFESQVEMGRGVWADSYKNSWQAKKNKTPQKKIKQKKNPNLCVNKCLLYSLHAAPWWPLIGQ